MAALFTVTAALYVAAAALYLDFLGRGRERSAGAGAALLGLGAALHLAFLLAEGLRGASPVGADIQQALSVASWLVALGLLATTRGKPRLRVLGAFVTPVTLLLFLGAGFRRGVAVVGEEMRSALLPVHVAANVLGLVAFALAFGVAVAYLVQERQLRRKQLGALFQRLPPLDVLDALSFRLVATGFPMFTLGVVTGTVWAVQRDPSAPAIDATQTVGLLAWATFAMVLLLRVVVGFRGRRAAFGTALGFLGACAVLVGYVVRQDGGS
jgi:ABC-type transport system involved in cytochrome c biogenesis permease subunit